MNDVGNLPALPSVDVLKRIMEMAADPNIDPNRIETLINLHRSLQADWAATEYHKAMNAAQAAIQPVARTAENKQTNSLYAKLEHVDAAIRPIYLRHGFSLSYNTVPPLAAGNIRIECTCSHVEGHSEKFGREAPADTLGPKGAPVKTVLHGGASTETFLKRYLACGIFNVVFKNQDDDGVRGGAEFISDEDCAELSRMLTETNSNVDKFLDYMKVAAIPDIQQKDLARAKNAIARKRSTPA